MYVHYMKRERERERVRNKKRRDRKGFDTLPTFITVLSPSQERRRMGARPSIASAIRHAAPPYQQVPP